ncbi:hypothetical protein COB55_05465 [Candidatus Wolfebacteria bacterium]|nr:MAG: hypothetical protein COB55_05465 [Candidatus Wolfebacteria bacterium]
MLNFLPEKKQKEIKRVYRTRLTIVVSVGVIIISIVCFALLTPSYYLVNKASNSAALLVENITRIIEESDVADAQVVMNSFSKELKLLKDIESERYASERIADIVAVQPRGITLGKLLLLRGEKSVLHIGGIARDREELVTYKAILEGLTWADEVDLPIENLAQGRDLPFSMTVTGEF